MGRRGVWAFLTRLSPSELQILCGLEGSFHAALHRSGLLLIQKGSSSLSCALEWLAGLRTEAGPMRGTLGSLSAERLRALGP